MKNRYLILTAILFYSITSFSEENQKPFVKEHKEHKHKINFVNATVYQQIKDFGALYNTSHIFLEEDIDNSQLFFFNVSITFGDGIINKLEQNGYSIYSTGDDLETYLNNINDSGRKYILELYYQKAIKNLVFAFGFIDSTSFVDTNNYANDEHIQFLNSAFINNPIVPLPSYNLGVYTNYSLNEENSISAVFMDNSPNSENVYIFEYELEKDTYNIRTFLSQTTKTKQTGIGISADYTYNQKLGLFFRGGYSNSDYNIFLSTGIEAFKNIFDSDTFGFAFGFINAKKGYLKDVYISEMFYEIKPKDFIALTFDVQYMKEYKENIIWGSRIYISY